MKKLLSLFVLVLISSQMWANNYPLKVNVTNGTYSTPQVSSSGSSYTNIGSATNNLTGGYYVKVTVTPSKNTYTLDSWNVSNPYSSTTPSITQSGNSYIIAFRAASYVSQSTGLTVTVVFTDPNATPEPEPEPTVLTAPGVVDLGLSVLWADRNLGAASSSESGYYYAWGEIEPKDNYVSAGYSNPYTTFSDANDVARQKLGNNWRMPTYTEVSELVNSTSCSYTASGVTITGNGASIYIPRAGHMDGTTKKATDRVWLWTRSYYDNTQAKIIFAQSNSCISASSYYSCYCGMPVRAVYVGTTATATFKNGTTTIKTQKVIPGTAPTAPANPTKDADEDYTYAFTGWSTSQNGSVAAIGNINSNTTYYAQFSATPKPVAKYTVTITSPEGGTGTLTVTAGGNTVTSGAELNKNTVITVTATPAEHYTGGAVVMQGETPVALTNNQFTLAGDVTISTNFVEDAKYTVNITTPENGTISVMNGSTPVKSGDQVYTGTVLTVTATGDTENHYEFKSWKEGTPALTNNQFTLNSDVTIGANFGLEVYTIRFLMDDGETVLSSAQVAYNDNPIQPVEPSKIETEEYSYNFVGWDANNDGIADYVTPVTGDQDYVAVFEQVALTPKYDITIGALTNGSVTITTDGGTEVVPAAGGTFRYEEGTTVILNAIAERGYHFTTWSDDTENAKKRIASLEANTTLTPTFAVNTPFELRDAWTESDCQNNYDMDNVLTITLTDRTFKQNEWATISLPFNCTLTQGDDMYGYIYKFGKVTLAADGGSINVEFNRTYEITANEPYLVVTQENITAPKFYGVSLVSPESVSLSSDGQVSFVSNLWKMTINGPRDFYVGNRSALRYAKTTGTVINANRAFFRKSETAPSPRRMVIVIDGVETNMEISEDGDIVETQDTRKYIENGALIIERGGVRYNATGAVAQ